MRVLMLTDFYPPTIGGVEEHVATLSRHLTKRGHDVSVCTVKQSNTKPSEVRDGVHVYALDILTQKIPFAFRDPSKRFHPPFKDLRVAKQLKRIVKDFKPDSIHSHGWIVFSYLDLKPRLKIPVVHTLHHYGLICPRQDFFFKNVSICTKPFNLACYVCCAEQQGLAKSILTVTYIKKNRGKLSGIDSFLAVSDFVRKVHTRHLRIPNEKISVVPNFLACMHAPEERLQHQYYVGILPKNFILYIGALMPHKGVDILLEAYRLSNVDFPLVLIGSKHSNRDFRKYHDGKKIFVIENAPRGLLIEAYEKCEFVVIPSVWAEAFGIVALEAMASGKPVVASNVGGLKDSVVDHETGLLVPPGDVKDLSEAIREMASMWEMRSKMGAKARKRFSELFTVEKTIPMIEKAYNSLH